MKLIFAIVALAAPAVAGAQAFKAQDFAPSTTTTVYVPTWNYNVSPGHGDNDTPTMRVQREKRIAVFRDKLDRALANGNGTLTVEDRSYIRREWIKLAYHNR